MSKIFDWKNSIFIKIIKLEHVYIQSVHIPKKLFLSCSISSHEKTFTNKLALGSTENIRELCVTLIPAEGRSWW